MDNLLHIVLSLYPSLNGYCDNKILEKPTKMVINVASTALVPTNKGIEIEARHAFLNSLRSFLSYYLKK